MSREPGGLASVRADVSSARTTLWEREIPAASAVAANQATSAWDRKDSTGQVPAKESPTFGRFLALIGDRLVPPVQWSCAEPPRGDATFAGRTSRPI